VKLVVLPLPARPAERRHGQGQRFAKQGQHSPIGNRQLCNRFAVTPGGELVEYPLAVLADQRFNVALTCP